MMKRITLTVVVTTLMLGGMIVSEAAAQQTYARSSNAQVGSTGSYWTASSASSVGNAVETRRCPTCGKMHASSAFSQTLPGNPAVSHVTTSSPVPVAAFEAQTFTSNQNSIGIQATPTQPANGSNILSPSNQNRLGSVTSDLAQQKATRAARMGLRGHLGGGLGGARFEGVGWSNQSARQAIESCCYWGVRPTAQIGTAQGADGFWYACVLYH